MNRLQLLVPATSVAVLAMGSGVREAEKLELKNVHMYCNGCAEEAASIRGKVDGLSGVTTDKKASDVRPR